MGRVEGKVALITGAASGLGAADAVRLGEEGSRVVLTDVNEEQGREIAASIPGAIFWPLDVRDEEQWTHVVAETMKKFGRLDILVNNAGIAKFGSVENCTLEEYRLLNAIMSEGTFLGCKTTIAAMAKGGGGSIINMSSVAAIKGISAIPAYSAAKGAILSLTRCVAAYCNDNKYGIRCNAIVAGSHDSPMTREALTLLDPEIGAHEIEGFGQGQPVDVANLVLFLASDEARQITGAHFVIDNGETG